MLEMQCWSGWGTRTEPFKFQVPKGMSAEENLAWGQSMWLSTAGTPAERDNG